jgi:hypothetical protein
LHNPLPVPESLPEEEERLLLLLRSPDRDRDLDTKYDEGAGKFPKISVMNPDAGSVYQKFNKTLEQVQYFIIFDDILTVPYLMDNIFFFKYGMPGGIRMWPDP